jgi:hypothetical protein
LPRIRTALFLDFDNIFGGLLQVERQAALVLAQDPALWVERLGRRLGIDGHRRDFLVQRAYLNPAGKVRDELDGNDSGWLYLQRFRPNLTRAGFEVVDCPTLTTGQKNAADIRIVLDCLSLMDMENCYDEFVIASSDADFTPLLQRIRSRDKRRVIIASGPSAPAYSSVASLVIDEPQLVELLLDPVVESGPVAAGGVAAPAAADCAMDDGLAALRQRVQDALIGDVRASPCAVLLSDLGLRLRAKFNDVIDRTNWFGQARLGDFIRTLPAGTGLTVSRYHVWCEGEHEPPADADAGGLASLPAAVSQMARITNLPRLASASWPPLFRALEEYARTHTFHLTECTAWTRDQLNASGHRIARTAIGFVVRGAMMAGVRLDTAPPPTAEQLTEAIASTTVDRSLAQGLDLSESDQRELWDWLNGRGA